MSQLDIKRIQPQKGEFSCNLWENMHIGLPLTLFYSIEIPLVPFDTGHDYVSQPTSTSIAIEWLKFKDPKTGENIKNWKNLIGKEFLITYEDETGEGSTYLGSEHCQFNSIIKFLSVQGTIFNIELTLDVAFNIDTINLDNTGQLTINAQIDFTGLLLYDDASLPTLSKANNLMVLLSEFIDLSVYQDALNIYENPNVQWRQLKPQ